MYFYVLILLCLSMSFLCHHIRFYYSYAAKWVVADTATRTELKTADDKEKATPSPSVHKDSTKATPSTSATAATVAQNIEDAPSLSVIAATTEKDLTAAAAAIAKKKAAADARRETAAKKKKAADEKKAAAAKEAATTPAADDDAATTSAATNEATQKKGVTTTTATAGVPKTSRSGRRCVPPTNDGVGKYSKDKKK
jgi:colicin import membrane protein